MRSIFFLYLFLLLPIWAKTPVSLLKEISVELSKLDDGLIKKLIEERVKEAWALTSDLEKEAALSDLLRELRKVNPVENELALNLGKEIELCNYLIQQACILEALDGAGSKDLFNQLKLKTSVSVKFVESIQEVPCLLESCVRPGDLVVTQGAGETAQIARALTERWQSEETIS